jgi:1,4-alpha-glucan branching enzyme
MGNEFGQTEEWNYKTSLRWDLLEHESHKGLQHCVAGLAKLLKSEKALHERQFNPDGFSWHDLSHRQESVITFMRFSAEGNEQLMVILNMTPVERKDWCIRVDEQSSWTEIFNSDHESFWGTGHFKNEQQLDSIADTENSDVFQVKINLPPLGGIIIKKA